MINFNFSFSTIQKIFFGVSAVNLSVIGLSYYSYKNSRPPYENKPPPTEEYRLGLFNLIASEYDRMYAKNEEITGIQKFRKAIFKRACGHVLELAAGTGRNLNMLSQTSNIKSVTCVDKSENMCEELKKKIEEIKPPFPVLVIHGDCKNLNFENAVMDTVMSSFSLCSFQEPEECLKEACRIMKPNGRLLLMERGQAKSKIIRWILKNLNLYPNPRIAWEYGYFEDRDPIFILNKLGISIKMIKHELLGTLHLISASPPITSTVSNDNSNISTFQNFKSSISTNSNKEISHSCMEMPKFNPSTTNDSRVFYFYSPNSKTE